MFAKSNKRFSYISNPENLMDKLPPAVYSLDWDKDSGFSVNYLFDAFILPSHIYTDTTEHNAARFTDIVLSEYNRKEKNVGVLLNGVKGTGKSLMFKLIANKAINKGLPILMIQDKFNSLAMSKYLSAIEDELVVVFDEFEKLYTTKEDHNSQSDLLSFFDGTSNTKKLFILATNDKSKISSFLLNRPGRIRYMLEFKALSNEFVHTFLSTNLNDKSVVETVCDYLTEVDELNFDMLQAVTNEVNTLYPNMSIKEIFNILNVKITDVGYDDYDAKYYLNDVYVDQSVVSIDFRNLEVNNSYIYLPKGFTNSNSADDYFNARIHLDVGCIVFNKGKNMFTFTAQSTVKGVEGELKIVFNRKRAVKI